MIKIERVWAMPNKRTFTIKPISELINLYSNECYTIGEPFPFNYKEDATDYLKRIKPVDLLLFDPTYSPRQQKE